MKKILSISLLFFSLCAFAQIDTTKLLTDTSQIKFTEPPDSTGFGTPDGQLVSKEIGPAGGTIASDDGRIELIFPADAVTVNTNISIQPITNLGPNGAGKAYKCEPSGVQFIKPVQIIFHYTDSEARTCPPELMGLIVQDDTGKWNFFDYDECDTTAKILKGTLEHFSTPANSYKFKLVPARRSMMVNQAIRVSVSGTFKKFKNKKSRKLTDVELSRFFYKWFVNYTEGGNASIGTIGDVKDNSCTYKAPSAVPDPNPVTITVDLSNGQALNCNVEVYDGYQVTVTAIWKDFSAGDGIKADLREYSSFVIKFLSNSKWRVDRGDIKNSLLLLERLTCPADCKKKCRYINRDECTGIINIDGVRSIQISEIAPGAKEMLITLEKSHGLMPLIDGGGAAGCGGFLLSHNLPAPRLPAVPEIIKFPMDANNHNEYDFDLSQITFSCHVIVSADRLSPGE